MSTETINLEFIVAPEMGGKVFGFHVSQDGNYSVETTKNAAMLVTGSYIMDITDYIKLLSKANITIDAMRELTVHSAKSAITVDGQSETTAGTYKVSAKTTEIGGDTSVTVKSPTIKVDGDAVSVGKLPQVPVPLYPPLNQILVDIIAVINGVPCTPLAPLDPTIGARLASALLQLKSKNVTIS
jgi:hypothetical protein